MNTSYTVITGFSHTTADGKEMKHEGKPIEITVVETGSGAMAGLVSAAAAVLALYAF